MIMGIMVMIIVSNIVVLVTIINAGELVRDVMTISTGC